MLLQKAVELVCANKVVNCLPGIIRVVGNCFDERTLFDIVDYYRGRATRFIRAAEGYRFGSMRQTFQIRKGHR